MARPLTQQSLAFLAVNPQAVQNVGNMDTPASRAKEAWMEPLQPTVRQGVAQLKDFITKLVDIQEKEGERFPVRPRPHPPITFAPPPSHGLAAFSASRSSTHSLLLKFAPPPAPPSVCPSFPSRGLTCRLPSLAYRAGPAAGPELAGAASEGGAALHTQDQGQGPPHVLLL